MGAWENTIGASDEWFTPRYIFDALGETFDLDPAHPRTPTHVPATVTFKERSLEYDWHGFVWLNPPFGGRNSIAPWLNKFFDHGNGIALTPDRTSAPWFRDAWQRAYSVMFLPKVKFVRPDGTLGKQPGNGTALWAAGSRAMAALKRAERVGLGILALPVGDARTPSAETFERGGAGAWGGKGGSILGTHNYSTSPVSHSEQRPFT
jgi:hypothetical protein